MSISDRQKRIDQLSFLKRLNLKVFSHYLRMYFYFDHFIVRSFSSYLFDAAPYPPVRVVNKIAEANVLVVHDRIKLWEKEYLIDQYRRLLEPKFVVQFSFKEELGDEFEGDFVDVAKLIPVDLKISPYVGDKELLTSFQNLVKQAVS